MSEAVRVLFVDDEEETRTAIESALEGESDRLDVATAETPRVALEILENEAVDCVLSDYRMPEMDGLEFLSRVRENWPELPFILYTGKGSEAVAGEAISTDVTAYVRKGGQPDSTHLSEQILTAVDRQRVERRAREYERTATLVRDVQADLVRARTLSEIDEAVCESFVDADPYVFAWIGDVDETKQRVTPRASAGHEDGYLEAVEITTDDSETSQGPTGRAVETHTIQVMQKLQEEPAYEPWRTDAHERGYRSSAAIPLVYDDSLYGVLNVYADRPDAFDTDEQALLEELGETIAHACHRAWVQREYESQYREMFTEAPVMIARTRNEDSGPVIEECNTRFADALGYSHRELHGKPLVDLYTDTSTEQLLDQGGYERALEGEFTLQERELVTADGERLVTLLQATPRRNAEGEVVGTHALYVDITERKRAQEVIEQAEAMEASIDGMAILDESGEFVYANDAHADIYGYDDPSEFTGHTWRLLYEDTEIERIEDDVIPALQADGTWRGEATALRADGSTFEQALSLTRLDSGGLVCVVRDITERKRRAQKLESLKKRFEAFVEYSSDIITIIGGDGTIRYESPAAGRMLGYEPGTRVGDNVFEYVHPDDRRDVLEPFENLVEHDTSVTQQVEYRFKHADGSWVWLESIGADRTDTVIDGYVVNSRDITERKDRERTLHQFREAVEQTAHAVYITDADGTIEYVNPAFETITGYSEEDVLGQTPQILQSGEHDEEFYQTFWETIDSGDQWESEMVDERADGERIILQQTVSPLVTDDGDSKKFVAVAQDVTERKEYEEALEAAREELRQVIDLVPDLIFAKNRDGEYLLANETTAKAYGLTPAEVEGKREPDIIPSLDDSTEFREDDLQVIESGEPKHIPEEELTTASGETRILETTKIPYEVPGSGEDAVLGYARDITELKTYERRLERQRDNLEVLNQVVRHDIRNDLQLVLTYAEILDRRVDDEQSNYVNQVLTAARDAIAITETARDVTEVMLKSDVDPFPVRLGYVLEDQIESIRSNYENATITVDESVPDVTVPADDMLSSVFRNLLSNAIQHNDKENPEVVISATVADDDVVVRIADNGPGIPDEHKEEIFDQGGMGLESEGTGLGLYLVETLVERYGGTVRVEDNEPTGSVFVVRLPTDR